jgi:hypothetical protein
MLVRPDNLRQQCHYRDLPFLVEGLSLIWQPFTSQTILPNWYTKERGFLPS